jgi:Zn-finger protein
MKVAGLTEAPRAICPECQVEAEVLEITTGPGQKLWRCGHCLNWHDLELTGLIVARIKNPDCDEQTRIASQNDTQAMT